MREPASPCVSCNDRHVGCHSTCDGYAEWKAKEHLYKKWLYVKRHPEIKEYITEKRHRGRNNDQR